MHSTMIARAHLATKSTNLLQDATLPTASNRNPKQTRESRLVTLLNSVNKRGELDTRSEPVPIG